MGLVDDLFTRLAKKEAAQRGAGVLTADQENAVARERRAHDARINAGSLREVYEGDLRRFQQDTPHSAPLIEPRDP